MEHFGIPHDEQHQFLQWGPIDEIFNGWCKFFDEKGIQYEIGGAGENWTIYKHKSRVDVDEPGCSLCCPLASDL